jgi:hypothetical protein
MGDGARRHGVDQHLESTLPDPTEEVEILKTEKPFRIGEDTRVEHGPRQQRRPPTGDVDRYELARIPHGRDQILGMGSSAHESSPVGNHRPDGLFGQPATTFGPSDDIGQPRSGEGKKSNVVLAQVRPVNGRVVERRLHAGSEATGRSHVSWQSDQSHAGLQYGVLETPGPVDHDNHPFSSKAFLLNERAHHCGSEPWSSMREDDGRDRRRHRPRGATGFV